MIIVYNLGGLLVGAAGVLVGGMSIAATDNAGVGILALALAWVVLGFLWRRWKTPPGQPRPYPSVFFIPLPFLAIPIIPFAVIMLVAEANQPGRERAAIDPRAASFTNDEQELGRSAVGGDVELSQYVATALSANLTEEVKADQYHVFTRVNPASVLVLVKAPNLKSYKDAARVQLLQFIAGLLSKRDDLKEKKAYIGIKGNLAFGAIQVPPDRVQTGSVLLESPLYEFYEPAPDASADAHPASLSGTDPRTESPDGAVAPTPAQVEEPANN